MKKITLVICGLTALSKLNSQTSENMIPMHNVEVLKCESVGISRPLSEIMEKTEAVEDAPAYERVESPDRENRKAQEFKFKAEDGPEYTEDITSRQTAMGNRTAMTPIANWAGQSGNSYPPDPTGAVGLTYYVQAVNATPFKIFNKITGAQVGTVRNLGSLWSPAASDDGDPVVMYDQYADRWVLCQFKFSSPYKIYMAVSTTNNPTGTYYTYTFSSSELPDYGKFSIWADGYYMTSNQNTDKVFCFERDVMLTGSATARSLSVNFSTGPTNNFFVPMPADADGALPPLGTPLPFFVYNDNAWGGGATDAVKIWNMTVSWAAAATASISASPAIIPCTSFDASYNSSWNDVSQPGTTQKLDGIGGVCMYRAQWRKWTGYNTVVLNWAVKLSSTQRSIRWCELRQDQITNVWSMYQQSTYAPDAVTRWIGSIAMNSVGTIALCYAKSDATSVYPSLAYTGRLASDPLGTMTFAERTAASGTGSQTGGINRFGDYSETTVDPFDGITFWHTGEYILGGNVATRIYSFKLLDPSGLGINENESANGVVNVFQRDNEINVIGTVLPESGDLAVDLFDIRGRQVSSKTVNVESNSFETTIDASGLATGTYMVRVGKMNTSFQQVKRVFIK